MLFPAKHFHTSYHLLRSMRFFLCSFPRPDSQCLRLDKHLNLLKN